MNRIIKLSILQNRFLFLNKNIIKNNMKKYDFCLEKKYNEKCNNINNNNNNSSISNSNSSINNNLIILNKYNNNNNNNRTYNNNNRTYNNNNRRIISRFFLASSPIAMIDFSEESNPKSEIVFLSGKALSSLTQHLFENEYGQSIFCCFLILAYFALLGHEGKLNSAVNTLKFRYSLDMKTLGHPKYKKFLSPNPLLSYKK